MLVGGWSFSLYLLQLIFKNLREICKSYWQYLLGRCEPAGLAASPVSVSYWSCWRYAEAPVPSVLPLGSSCS